MDEQRELIKKIETLDRTLALTRTQRDRARYDLEIFAGEYAQLVRQIKRLPWWIRRIFGLRVTTYRA